MIIVMPPDRVVCARRLSELLSSDTGVDVSVKYDRDRDHYAVRWQQGPCEEYMKALACGHAHEVEGLTIEGLTWERS